MKKIKVAFFAEILVEDHDGATRTMFQLIKRIPTTDFEFLFICAEGSDVKLLGHRCINVPALQLPINKNYKMSVPALVRGSLNEQLDKFAPDVIHVATPSLLGEFAVKYAHRKDVPVISIYHTHFVAYVDYYLKRLPFLISFAKGRMIAGQQVFYNQCDKIYVPSESMAAELKSWGVEPQRLIMWKRGIDRQLFSPQKKDSVAMYRLTGNTLPTLLFASRLVWEKNLQTLFNIYNLLRQCSIQFNMVIAGDGAARQACEQAMPAAIFTGKVDHQKLAMLYASADVFVFPSVSETYGNVVIEAMSSGIPCVVADGGGSRDFITHGHNGFKCPPYEAKAYANCIVELFNSPQLREKFREEGIKYSRPFNWNDLAETYFEDLYRLAGVEAFSVAQ